MFRIQESVKNTSVSPLLEKDLDLIREQLTEWDNQYGSNTISQYLYDVAFFRLVKHQGFLYANDLLTETRKALKRSVGSHNLTWYQRCKNQAKKAKLQTKAEESAQPQVEAA